MWLERTTKESTNENARHHNPFAKHTAKKGTNEKATTHIWTHFNAST